MVPLLPRTALHLLNAFIIIAVLFILFFPTLSYTKSVYRPSEDVPTIITDASFPDKTVLPNMLLKFQQAEDRTRYGDSASDGPRNRLDHPSRVSVLSIITSTFRVIWTGILLMGQFMSYILRPLQIITIFLFNKFLFLLQPFIIMGTGLYIVIVVWPIQIVNYLIKTFYPLYIFLACASIVGLLVGGIANFAATFLNNAIFPPRQPFKQKLLPPSRPKTSESQAESVTSSGSVTPAPPTRVPPPSKFPSSIDDIRILDTNALFSSFSLPIPPPTPPGILYSAPTPAGSVSGVVVGETIFEEEDDSDEKTPVATSTQQESWGFGAGKPLTRAESAHGRMSGQIEHVGMGTWHGKVKREDVDAQGIDWGDDGVRRRKKGVAG